MIDEEDSPYDPEDEKAIDEAFAICWTCLACGTTLGNVENERCCFCGTERGYSGPRIYEG